MKKTLIVKYTPREGSNTEKLVEKFKESAKDTEIEEIDLAENLPPLFDKVSLNAYVKKYYARAEVEGEEKESLRYITEMVKKVKEADTIVIAYPMYNLSVPAAIKAWIDSVTVAGETFTMTEDGVKGLLEGKKAIVLTSSGSAYYKEPMKSLNFNTNFMEASLGFIGLEVRIVCVQGTNTTKLEDNLEEKYEEIEKIATEA